MARVVGVDRKKLKRVTCANCASILEYRENEVEIAKYTIMGDPSGHHYVRCPNCGGQAKIPGTSW